MAGSDANSIQLSYKKEGTFKTNPAGTGWKIIRHTGESIASNGEYTRSAEIASDRQTPDIIQTSIGADGDANFELSYGAYDDWMEWGLLSAVWTTQAAVATAVTNVTVASPANTYTTAATWTNTPAVGSWIYVSGFANAANNGFKQVTASSTTVVTVSQTLTAEAAGATVTLVNLAEIKNGTTLSTMHIEKAYTDIASLYAFFAGMAIEGMKLTIPTSGICTGSFSFIGARETSSASAAGSGYTAAPTNPIINSISGIAELLENGSAINATEVGIEVKNNLRARLQIGTLGAESIGKGTCEVKGSLKMYFATSTLMDKYLNATASSLVIRYADSATDGYLIHIPRIRYTSGKRVAGSLNSDIIADLAWEAMKDPTFGYTIKICKYAI